MKILKICNPFIYLINFFNYLVHLEDYHYCKKYELYDFSKDIKYF